MIIRSSHWRLDVPCHSASSRADGAGQTDGRIGTVAGAGCVWAATKASVRFAKPAGGARGPRSGASGRRDVRIRSRFRRSSGPRAGSARASSTCRDSPSSRAPRQ